MIFDVDFCDIAATHAVELTISMKIYVCGNETPGSLFTLIYAAHEPGDDTINPSVGMRFKLQSATDDSGGAWTYAAGLFNTYDFIITATPLA